MNWKDEIPNILKMMEDGATSQDLADHYGVKRNTLISGCSNHGIKMKNKISRCKNKPEPWIEKAKEKMKRDPFNMARGESNG